MPTLTHNKSGADHIFKPLKDKKEFVDARLCSESSKDRFVHGHRIVLAGVSSILRRHFTKSPNILEPIVLKNMDHETIEQIVDFIYTGKIDILEDDWDDFSVACRMINLRLGSQTDKQLYEEDEDEKEKSPIKVKSPLNIKKEFNVDMIPTSSDAPVKNPTRPKPSDDYDLPFPDHQMPSSSLNAGLISCVSGIKHKRRLKLEPNTSQSKAENEFSAASSDFSLKKGTNGFYNICVENIVSDEKRKAVQNLCSLSGTIMDLINTPDSVYAAYKTQIEAKKTIQQLERNGNPCHPSTIYPIIDLPQDSRPVSPPSSLDVLDIPPILSQPPPPLPPGVGFGGFVQSPSQVPFTSQPPPPVPFSSHLPPPAPFASHVNQPGMGGVPAGPHSSRGMAPRPVPRGERGKFPVPHLDTGNALPAQLCNQPPPFLTKPPPKAPFISQPPPPVPFSSKPPFSLNQPPPQKPAFGTQQPNLELFSNPAPQFSGGRRVSQEDRDFGGNSRNNKMADRRPLGPPAGHGPPIQVYIGNLPNKTNEKWLAKYLKKCTYIRGSIRIFETSAKLAPTRCKTYGFVDCAGREEANNFIKSLHGKPCRKRILVVKDAAEGKKTKQMKQESTLGVLGSPPVDGEEEEQEGVLGRHPQDEGGVLGRRPQEEGVVLGRHPQEEGGVLERHPQDEEMERRSSEQERERFQRRSTERERMNPSADMRKDRKEGDWDWKRSRGRQAADEDMEEDDEWDWKRLDQGSEGLFEQPPPPGMEDQGKERFQNQNTVSICEPDTCQPTLDDEDDDDEYSINEEY